MRSRVGPVTAEEVLDAAVSEFERGYGATTLDKIGRRLGITRQGVLHHFPSKDAVFLAVLRRERQWAFDSDKRPTDVVESLRSLRTFTGASVASRKHIRLMQVLHGEAIAGNMTAATFIEERLGVIDKRVRTIIAGVDSAGGLAAPWNVESAASCLTALIHGLQARVLIDPDIDVGASFDSFLSALCTPDFALVGLITESANS